MPYCTNCGAELNEFSSFCGKCGQPTNLQSAGLEQEKDTMQKCPCCGGNISAFEIVCPFCGFELRRTNASATMKEFAEKIEHLSSSRKRGDKDSLINLIRTFPIPNNKEDLFEFLILAGANVPDEMERSLFSERKVSEAWKAKYEQAYQKAKILLINDSEFVAYEKTRAEKEKRKKEKEKKALILSGVILGAALLIELTVILGVTLFEKNEKEKENKRLEAIVGEIYEYLELEKYVLARAKATTLVYGGPGYGDEKERWDETRIQLLTTIDKAEYGPDYKPEIQEIVVGIDSEKLNDMKYEEVKSYFENRGFTNIITQKIEDEKASPLKENGEVEQITVDGKNLFDASDTFMSNVEIIISYSRK